MPVQLNCHSYFSLLEALPSPAELAQAAASRGMTALALTDHYSLAGAVEFDSACRKAGIQPIFGLEVDLAALSIRQPGNHRIILLAQDEQGWSNLCSLSSALNLNLPPANPASLDILNAHSQHLLALCAAQDDGSDKLLQALAEVFPGRLYVSLSNPDGRQQIAMERSAFLANRLGLPVAAVQPVYTLDPGKADLLKTLAAIRLNTPVNSLRTEALPPPGSVLLSAEQLRLRFRDFPAALASAEEVAQRCAFSLPLGRPNFPAVPLPENNSAIQLLRSKVESGAVERYGRMTPAIQARLDHELEIIGQLQYEPIFLIVDEIIRFARRQGIPTSSRGSAASSLVAYCLGITNPDPIRLNLYFERFLNPARTSPPDIDTDICSRGRDKVIRHVFEVFGHDQTAMIGTINRFRPRSAITDVAKAYGMTPSQAHDLSRTLPYSFFYRMDDGEGSAPSPFHELAGTHQDPLYRSAFRDAEAILNLPRHFSIHAGGIVVGPGRLGEIIPLQRSGAHNTIITQMDMESVQAFGLVKIDLLGIRGLTVLGDVAEAVQSWRKVHYATPLQVLDEIPLEDQVTSDLILSGHTIGCFQIESPGVRATLREINAHSPDDIMAALALYKPGPIKGGLREAFVKRFKGQEPVEHLHPLVAPILEETYGIILYQEQVLRLAHELAGLSLADADLLRRAISHFGSNIVLEDIHQRFVRAVHENRQISIEICEQLWSLMAAFAGYGLPKAHAASYGLAAWKSAWLKAHFPAEFMAAVLANWGGYYSQRVYINECRRMGLIVKPPHINHSTVQFSAAYPQGEPVLYMGLDQVRDLTRHTQEKIINGRPFNTLDDFLARVDPRQKEAENLASVGALEGLGAIPALLQRISGGKWISQQPGLFNIEEAAADWRPDEVMLAQQEILGISLAAHPLELHVDKIIQAGAITTLQAQEKIGEKVSVAGIRQAAHRVRTSKGEAMLFLTLEDLEGSLDVMILPDLYRRIKNMVYDMAPFIVSGVLEYDEVRGEPLLRADSFRQLK
ncbi:MAG TPA: DNA polymerase III subunit alpha [Anaerolineaceae bacterium]|nr:DNA polymerase III subunit alpha [Anaerolineaceae bacterium]